MNEQTRTVPEEKVEVELVDDKTQNDISIKVLVIGDVEVGNTTIFNQFTKHEFYPSYSPTTGYDFFSVKLKTNNKVMKLQIWDTSGNPSYRATCLQWFRNSELCIVVYSVTNLDSFNNVKIWINDLRANNSDAPIVLLGNQSDDEENRAVTKEMGEKIKEEYNLEFFEEVSAKNGFDQKDNFVFKIAKILYYNIINDAESWNYTMNESIRLESPKKKGKKNDCKC